MECIFTEEPFIAGTILQSLCFERAKEAKKQKSKKAKIKTESEKFTKSKLSSKLSS